MLPVNRAELAAELRSIAQNEFMIDGHYLNSGHYLVSAADVLDCNPEPNPGCQVTGHSLPALQSNCNQCRRNAGLPPLMVARENPDGTYNL